jgi:predicted phosphodiesterase
MKFTLFSFLFIFCHLTYAQTYEQQLPPENPSIIYRPSEIPDRIILSISDPGSKSKTVTWRTKRTSVPGKLEISILTSEAEFYKKNKEYTAISQDHLTFSGDSVTYHKVELNDLLPGQVYAYRVGNEKYWSEWIDLKHADQTDQAPWQLLYMGDAQNDLHSTWSRVIRAAAMAAPEAELILHAGDLINHSLNDYEWAEWFEAGGHLFAQTPQLATPGNHEYVKNSQGIKTEISPLWNLQFNYPKNGLAELPDQNFWFDYKNVRFLFLDSNTDIENQAKWLEEVLASNTQTWTIAVFHHPVLSGAEDRQNDGVLRHWKPILDRYQVDLVLQGHDHMYGRGQNANSGLGLWNENSGTTYVVAVSGRKMYELGDQSWMQVKAQDTPTYQILTIHRSHMNYQSFTWDGQINDSFRLEKETGKANKLIELR